VFSALAKPVAHFFNGLLNATVSKYSNKSRSVFSRRQNTNEYVDFAVILAGLCDNLSRLARAISRENMIQMAHIFWDCKNFCVNHKWHGHLGRVFSWAGSPCHKISYKPTFFEYIFKEPGTDKSKNSKL
jgi:hypothetical protein